MSQNVIPRVAVRSTAFGVLFMAFFGTLWAGIGIGGLQGWGFLWLLILSLMIGIMLLIGGMILIKASRGLSNEMSEADARRSKRVGMWFSVIYGLEGALIGAASAICDATNHFDLFFPVMGLIVGAHFFPLAHLFRVRTHYIAGSLLCLLAAITLLMVPARVTLGHHQIVAWWTSVGFGSALILWGTGAAVWLTGLRLLKRARNGFK
ncbi:hypothetical protein BVG16_15315 [Paenibacillus selenitireducens]|uniref:Uncharacterized protein n=1 Tax=Paenibacillus selenitireducens TaxID=1324314 RepID=A0A1T2XDV6_9BACL|nr:hypothetical protein [Paenibacillus selenitireducens]OPA77793.1 hypothetical protein BVG16_15315 [Paenibacillus selenitireducens]